MEARADARDGIVRNRDVDWDQWPVAQYIAENYATVHPADAAIIEHHSSYYRTLPPDSLSRSLELGAGPNLYTLMLAAASSRRIDALEPSAANRAYLQDQIRRGPDENWHHFYSRCRKRNPSLPPSPADALARVRVVEGGASSVRAGRYDLASMHFVAEGVTEDVDEFVGFCGRFVTAVRPHGHLVAAFMENMGSYALGTGPRWPAHPVDVDLLREVFEPQTDDLALERIGPDPSLPAYGYTGMVLLTARRASGSGGGRAPTSRLPAANHP